MRLFISLHKSWMCHWQIVVRLVISRSSCARGGIRKKKAKDPTMIAAESVDNQVYTHNNKLSHR
jgi:hypothetical protein